MGKQDKKKKVDCKHDWRLLKMNHIEINKHGKEVLYFYCTKCLTIKFL